MRRLKNKEIPYKHLNAAEFVHVPEEFVQLFMCNFYVTRYNFCKFSYSFTINIAGEITEWIWSGFWDTEKYLEIYRWKKERIINKNPPSIGAGACSTSDWLTATRRTTDLPSCPDLRPFPTTVDSVVDLEDTRRIHLFEISKIPVGRLHL